ncbi:hypothetical protein DFH08DRAFT_864979 [Mycena albidolilacea]|uniref:Uncharacterized protein n=1 Tax=Mycena albidolilacea TaxID=1033008 RepID=A0AAD7A598_9AGAR|nr:hypothetical protein DFH08DRAFT_864979 [Mycena albidolilacea]
MLHRERLLFGRLVWSLRRCALQHPSHPLPINHPFSPTKLFILIRRTWFPDTPSLTANPSGCFRIWIAIHVQP